MCDTGNRIPELMTLEHRFGHFFELSFAHTLHQQVHGVSTVSNEVYVHALVPCCTSKHPLTNPRYMDKDSFGMVMQTASVLPLEAMPE